MALAHNKTDSFPPHHSCRLAVFTTGTSDSTGVVPRVLGTMGKPLSSRAIKIIPWPGGGICWGRWICQARSDGGLPLKLLTCYFVPAVLHGPPPCHCCVPPPINPLATSPPIRPLLTYVSPPPVHPFVPMYIYIYIFCVFYSHLPLVFLPDPTMRHFILVVKNFHCSLPTPRMSPFFGLCPHYLLHSHFHHLRLCLSRLFLTVSGFCRF